MTVADAGLENGSMIYLTVDEEKLGVHENATKTGKVISKDGHIVAQRHHEVAQVAGFRPGMLPLSAIKRHWTLNEFLSLDEQFVYKIKRQESAVCKKVSLDTASLNEFQQYMWNFDYRKTRFVFVTFLYWTTMLRVYVSFE
jgi:hypothetical protein